MLQITDILSKGGHWNRRRLAIFLLGLVVLIVFSGGIFVYRRPNSRAAKNFARLIPFPAALVGSRIVWVNEVFAQEGYTVFYGQKTNQMIPEPSKIRADVLDRLIEVRLVESEISRHKISVSKKEVEASFETVASQSGGREQILTTLKDLYGMSESSFKNLMRDQLVIDKLKREILATVSVRHILVADEKRANELAGQVKEGADFSELAKKESKDVQSREAGGSLGFIGRGQTVKSFEDVAFALEPGQISDPVQSEFGWHVIKVEEKKGLIDKPYADWLPEAKNNTRIVKLLTK
jgi:parvulin-like peptidyl-prolyl isomerase